MKKTSKILAMILVLALLASCGGGGTPSDGGGGSTADPAASGSTAPGSTADPGSSTADGGSTRDDVIIGILNEPTMLDPAFAADSFGSMVILNTHDPLVRRGADGKPFPNLAKSWTVSDDGLEYTFELEQGVKFQDGSEMTAEDVAFSINRAIGNPASALYTTPFEKMEVVDTYTAKLTCKYRDPAVLQYLTGGNNCIVSKAIVESVGDSEYNNNICGTGPYKLVDWQKGSKLILVRNEDYWRGTPPVTNIELRVLKEATTMMVALENGDIDQTYNLQAIDIPTVQASDKLDYLETFGTSIWNINYNCEMEPFDNEKVRNALTMAINKQDIIDGAADGAGRVGNIILTPETAANPGEDAVDYLKYDPEAAKALLAEAGYPDGFNTTICVREDFTKKIGSIVQSQWQEIGVNAEIVVMERSALLTDMKSGTLPCYTVGNVSLTLDASFLLGTLGKVNIPASNYSFWSDPEYDRLLDEQAKESDEAKRLEMVNTMLNIEAKATPRTTLYYTVSNTAFDKNLNTEVHSSYEQYYWYTLSWKS